MSVGVMNEYLPSSVYTPTFSLFRYFWIGLLKSSAGLYSNGYGLPLAAVPPGNTFNASPVWLRDTDSKSSSYLSEDSL